MTNKQREWTKRVQLLWRIKGMTLPLYSISITQYEKDKLTTAFSLIREVVDNFTTSSIELGFNAKPRCKICGKKVISGNLCDTHLAIENGEY